MTGAGELDRGKIVRKPGTQRGGRYGEVGNRKRHDGGGELALPSPVVVLDRQQSASQFTEDGDFSHGSHDNLRSRVM